VDARNAGRSPNKSVTASAMAIPKPRTRQSAGKNKRAGLSGGLIIPTTNGAAHHANKPPSPAASSARHALRQNQLHQPPPSTANRNAQRQLARACGSLRGHQVGHIRASDQQNEHDEHAENREWAPRVCAQFRSAGSGRFEQHLLVQKRVQLFLWHAGRCAIHPLLLKCAGNGFELGAKRFHGSTGLNDCECTMPRPVVCGYSRMHHDRNENVHHRAWFGAGELSINDSYDFVNAIAHAKGSSHDFGILAKAMLPITLRQHRVRMRARLEIIVLREQSS
jgi:hypothetical protein